MSLGWVLALSVAVWVAAEIVLQVRQRRQASAVRYTESRTLWVVIALAGVGELLAELARTHLRGFALPDREALRVAALVLVWAGAGFRLWAVHSLGRYFRGTVHVQEGHRVVQSGPYRVLRHPAYTGALVGLLGLSLTFGNAVSILVFTGACLLAVLGRIRVEERVLTDALGPEYTRYAARTRRLVPGVW